MGQHRAGQGRPDGRNRPPEGPSRGDIIAYGGATFVSALIRHDLIDEYHLFVNPAALGTGLPIFKALDAPRAFVFEATKAFPCGIVLVRYRRAS
ncbi:MAG: dihydrofolate reductase family protein [Anaerolineae bacterium]